MKFRMGRGCPNCAVNNLFSNFNKLPNAVSVVVCGGVTYRYISTYLSQDCYDSHGESVGYIFAAVLEALHVHVVSLLGLAMDALKNLADYLESYSGRDKVMRILYYAAQFGAGRTSSSELQDKLNEFSDQINSCRTVLRLFDDIPMLHYTLSYGLGKEEPEKLISFCGVAVNTLDQLYYPVEHIAWAADCKLLPFKSDKWWTASSICWALSMYLMVVKSLRHRRIIQRIMENVAQMKDVPRERIHALSTLQNNEMLTAIRCLVDFIHAVHWLPHGFLWAGKLKQWHIGVLGILSSLISLYQS